ncbi:MAG: YIP1 family protein [Methanophagales archaeon]|nr:YIP1 family protein [Methanophagales archaeon]MCW3138726.1 YIP1 family protein [Methanophagales archaeon]MCW3140368.1 YIP1 family protein [Methanophagales archaeon]MCW7070650.1 YIP1 family protein [Methanophagales archaeon]
MLSQIRGFAFNPARQFAAAKDDSLSDAFKYYIPLLAILGAILSIVAAIGVNMIVSMLGLSGLVLMPGLPELGKIIPLLGVGTFVGTIILGIIAALYIAVWLHIWTYLLGGKKGLRQTTKAVLYGATPCLILGWLAPVNVLIAPIWSVLLVIAGLIELHELSPGRSIIAVTLAILVPVIVCIVAIKPLVSLLLSI